MAIHWSKVRLLLPLICQRPVIPGFTLNLLIRKELLNSDSLQYGGSGIGNLGGVHTDDYWHHGRQHSLNLVLPPLSVVMFKAGSK